MKKMKENKNRVMVIGAMKAGMFKDQLTARRIKHYVEHRNGNAVFTYVADDAEQAQLWATLRA